MQLKIIETEDGSTSLFDEKLKESYHSRFGAINESMHVFIEAGLNKIKELDSINILEVGLGTGLNALLTCLQSEKENLSINYVAIEPYPIEEEITNKMNFEKRLNTTNSNLYLKSIHKNSWDQLYSIHNRFNITKLKNKLELYQPPHNFFNLIYFDAFSPEIQPELWSLSNFIKIFNSLQRNGVLVTYCAKGQVRRDMETAGFKTERIPGPKGKREMLRATKP